MVFSSEASLLLAFIQVLFASGSHYVWVVLYLFPFLQYVICVCLLAFVIFLFGIWLLIALCFFRLHAIGIVSIYVFVIHPWFVVCFSFPLWPHSLILSSGFPFVWWINVFFFFQFLCFFSRAMLSALFPRVCRVWLFILQVHMDSLMLDPWCLLDYDMSFFNFWFVSIDVSVFFISSFVFVLWLIELGMQIGVVSVY